MTAGMLLGRFGAVKLRDIETELRGDLFDRRGRFVDEHADFPDSRGISPIQGSSCAAVTWRGLRIVKDEAERARPGFDGGQRVFAIGDAADFDEHQATSSRSARAASPDLTRCSPTRNAS